MRAFSILHGKSHGRAPPAGDRSLARFVSTRLHAALQQQAADAHEAEVARLIADGGSSEEVARLERRFAATTQHLAASAEAASEAVALSLEKCALAREYETTLAQPVRTTLSPNTPPEHLNPTAAWHTALAWDLSLCA